ncbi:MAG: DUF2784 domain-containing protein [Gemmataceae bacterium]|nr:DUF2784 domain-containing protein [Gemmataceae bacterium]MCS7271134.1 DUF2784 domain-containing protein [Gemmataceae bacterium]MDW8242019.1 DUF2784 domain-containing protein [Thermogemmata sp.]
MVYGLLADLVVIVHLAYVAYVLVGQVLIVIAAPFQWQWARNPWFRLTHLLAIGIVAYEAVMGIRCPLTVWEEQLREIAGQPFNSGETFLGRLAHYLLFYEDLPEIFFTTVYIAMLALVVQGLIMYPPRLFRLWTGTSRSLPTGDVCTDAAAACHPNP